MTNHAIFDRPLGVAPPPGYDQAIFGMGCYWGVERLFWQQNGIWLTEVGFAGGDVQNPTYDQVKRGDTGHAEAVRVTFDPDRIALADLYDVFMGTHDPSQLNRQGNDVGTQYRSAIFPLDDEQRSEAEAAIERWNADHDKDAVTTIEGPAEWYPAEDYHQEYWTGEGQRNPYCQAVIPPKLMKLRKSFQKYLKEDA